MSLFSHPQKRSHAACAVLSMYQGENMILAIAVIVSGVFSRRTLRS